MTQKVLLGASSKHEGIHLRFANRHGLITGATGTGKTVSLQVLSEGFSAAGVPVFAADIKGDLSGLAMAGDPDFRERSEDMDIPYESRAFPVALWDVFGEQGHPMRATIREMGPLLMSRLLELTQIQEGVLNIAFRLALDEGDRLDTLEDLREQLRYVANRAKELSSRYGNITRASVGAIQRRLLVLEEQGADKFFGHPMLAIDDLMAIAHDGRGYINILAADRLMESPQLYSAFLLWLLTKLWQELPEVGDLDKPRLVFFFDEAHLLFGEASKALLSRINQIIRLIRSKGVGIYFVSQSPLDVPDSVSSQLGNRVQHAMRAFTPKEQKSVRAAAETFRANPRLETAEVIMELGVGEALVSTLEGDGRPSIVQRTIIRPPETRIGPLTADERESVIAASPLLRKYGPRNWASNPSLVNKLKRIFA